MHNFALFMCGAFLGCAVGIAVTASAVAAGLDDARTARKMTGEDDKWTK